jgi:hypothetical protein
MYYCKNAHDFAGHGANTGHGIRPVIDRFPKPDGDGDITKVQ